MTAAAVSTSTSVSATKDVKRKSRPLRRKTSHSVIERRRREKINEGLIHLQKTVPACRQELKELLECKANMNKKSAKRDPIKLQEEVNRLLEEKIASQMVLEKLCIISHTVDYVEALQAKVEAYRKLCQCDPPMPEVKSSGSHHQLHQEEDVDDDGGNEQTQEESTTPTATISDEGEATINKCESCATVSRGKRHWGSNNPLNLSKVVAAPMKASQRDDSYFKTASITTSPAKRQPKRKAAPNSFPGQSDEDESESNSSDLELEEWCGKDHRIIPSQLYTDDPTAFQTTSRKRRATFDSIHAPVVFHDKQERCDDARLGLLAQVSVETSKYQSP